jgi:hypothetical protein
MRGSTPRELHALRAFAHELHAIKALYAQREWAMHEPTDFVDTVPSAAARDDRDVAMRHARSPLQLSVDRFSARP